MSGNPSPILEWKFKRDASGRLEGLSFPGGKEMQFSYESFPGEADQIKTATRRFSGGEVAYDYDRRGRRTAVADQTGTLHYEWDQFGQITSVRRSFGPRIVYRYDTLRRLKGCRAGSDFDVEYEYDFLSRIGAIKTPVGTVKYDYWTGQGRTTRTLPNGIRTIWDYEPDGQLAAITHVDPNDYRIAKFSYSYRSDGLIERILEWSLRGERHLSFEYDAVQRLVAVSDSAGKSWQSNYDGLGNRTKEIFGGGYAVDYRYDWAGRLTWVNGAACAHDDSGNLSLARLDGRLQRFEFDQDNRICRANQGEVHYEHDGIGCLVTRTCRGEKTVYIPDPLSDDWHPLVEFSPFGHQRFYLWEDRSPLAIVENGAATFFLHDHIGSVRCVADQSGKVIERRDFSTFGVFDSLRADSALVPGFAGLFWDPAASVYLTRARAYSPDLGRFLQRDPQHRVPLGSQKDLSAYVYCGNDPINWTDTIGLMPESVKDGGDKRRGRGRPQGADDGNDGNPTRPPKKDRGPIDPGTLPGGPDPSGAHGFGSPTPPPATSSGGDKSSVLPGGGGERDRTGPAPRSTWSRFTELLHTVTGSEVSLIATSSPAALFDVAKEIPDPREPAESSKSFHQNLAAKVIEWVTEDVNAYAEKKFGSKSGLTEDQLREARRGGLQKFFADYAGYLNYHGRYFQRIENLLTPSRYGTVDIDWLTTLGHTSSRFFNLPLSWLYVPEKLAWFVIRGLTTRTPGPDFRSFMLLLPREGWTAFYELFPLPGWNAAKLGDDLFSGRISIQDAMTPGPPTITSGGSGDGGSGPAEIKGVAGAFLHASADLLTPQESQEWKAEKVREAPPGDDHGAIGGEGGGGDGGSVQAEGVGASFVVSSNPLTAQERQEWEKEKVRGKKHGESDGGNGGGGTGKGVGGGGSGPKRRDRSSRRPWRSTIYPPWFQFPRWLWNLIGRDDPFRRGMSIPTDPEDSQPGGGAVAALSPSPVGGVFLGGAGALLEGLGQVTGVATDHETGKLILLTEQAGSIQLPPLRIDDVVTVFRSVYLYGEGPSVTINPRSSDPHGPWMDVVHGAATPDTYVGWVLFEADRIMKAYNLGEDNLSRTPVSSAVAGYDEVLNTVYFGGDFADGKKAGGNWERFWIVPAEVSRFHSSATKELTLFDVPLKVKTQRMILKGGKLEDDPKGKSSKGAMAFIEWFTRTYEGIAREQYLQPPPETGTHSRVPIFSELRRIALISAVAEHLRDRGIPMPLWMKDYEVKRIPVPDSTPAMTVTKTATTDNRIVAASIYGGVNLSPADEAVKQFDRGSNLKRLSPSQREVCTRQVAAAEDLAPAVMSAAKAKSMLVPISVPRGGRQVEAVALPGSDSKALAPCRLEEVDLDASVQAGGGVALVRHFNSFFRPNGLWGRTWTTDWPRLHEVKLPVERTDKDVRFKLVYELSTPLGSIHARFSEARHVPELNANLLVPDSKCDVLALAGANDPLVKQGRTEILFKDGRAWFFDEKGNFVGDQAKPLTTLYVRDSAGRVQQIIPFDGDRPQVFIQLGYDTLGRLESAESGGGDERITYQYDSEGYMESVTSAEGKTSYTYDRGLVRTISWSARIDSERFENPVLQREFKYAPNGQLLAEWADGVKTTYTVQMENGRHRLAIIPEDGSNGTVAVYDERLRPLEVTEPDNTRTQWAYDADGGFKTETVLPDGEVTKTRVSADGKHRLAETSDNVQVQEDCDEGDRLTNVSLNQRPVLQQEWYSNGLLKSMSCETHKVIPQYDEHGRLQSALQVKPAEGNRFSLWQETQFDESGRVKAVKDHTGSHVEVRYDSRGEVAGLATKRDGKDFGFNIKRNPAGQIELLNSSWGEERRRYDANGSLEEVVVKKGPSTANAEYSHGRIANSTQFDGSRVQFDYHAGGKEEGRLKSVQTPAVTLKYHYSPNGTMSGVDLGETCRINYEHDPQGNLVRLALEPRKD